MHLSFLLLVCFYFSSSVFSQLFSFLFFFTFFFLLVFLSFLLSCFFCTTEESPPISPLLLDNPLKIYHNNNNNNNNNNNKRNTNWCKPLFFSHKDQQSSVAEPMPSYLCSVFECTVRELVKVVCSQCTKTYCVRYDNHLINDLFYFFFIFLCNPFSENHRTPGGKGAGGGGGAVKIKLQRIMSWSCNYLSHYYSFLFFRYLLFSIDFSWSALKLEFWLWLVLCWVELGHWCIWLGRHHGPLNFKNWWAEKKMDFGTAM